MRYRIKNIWLNLMLAVCLTGIVFILMFYVEYKPELREMEGYCEELLISIDKNTFSKREDTQIFDCQNQLISEINTTNYQYADIDHISPYLYQAYIAAEDQNFMTHHGLDYSAILRAAISIVQNKGEIRQGGSTITQQVLKNNFLYEIPKFKRKMMEFMMAPKLEEKMNKDQIMEAYCNSNYYANNCYGAETASLYYYGKHCIDLSLGEAATLAGISNLPSKYDPLKHPEKAKEKRNYILNKMLDQGLISLKNYLLARQEIPVYSFQKEKRINEDYMTSYAIHCAAENLMKQKGFVFQYLFESEQEYDAYNAAYSNLYTEISSDIRLGGYKIYTSFDQEKQDSLQEILDKSVSFEQERNEDGFYTFQSAAVAVDNRTGYIIAIVGGREKEGEFNRGFQAIRQPGSAIKPLLVYGPAFDCNLYTPDSRMIDKPIKKGPSNAYRGYCGNISLYEAFCRSTNTIAYQILQDMGGSYGAEYLAALQFSHITVQDPQNPAIALGGFTRGVSVDEMAKGYAAIANHGNFSERNCIRTIEFRNDGVIWKDMDSFHRVYKKETAAMLNLCMKGVLTERFGTGTKRLVKNAIAGAKTGTTNDAKDLWFCGSSRYYTLAVWCGYDMPRASKLKAWQVPGYTWQTWMEKTHENLGYLDLILPTAKAGGF